MGSFLSLGTKQGKTCCHRKGKETNMKDKIFGVLQRIGGRFMLPIAIKAPPGCGPFAWNRKFADKRNDDRDLQSDGHPGRRNDFKCAIYHYDEGGECDF